MDRSQELEERVRNLSQTIEEMRIRMARLEGRDPEAADAKQSNRRGFLRLGAGAVLGALGWAAVRAVPASATDGGALTLGQANQAESATTLTSDSLTPPVQILGVSAPGTTWNPPTTGTFSGPLQGLGTSTGIVDGVDGWAGGTQGAGVHGLSDTGYGVIGESQGIGLYAQTSGRIRQDGLLLAGMPTYTANPFEQVRDANGVLWISDPSTVGWRRMNTVRLDAADGTGAPFKPVRVIDTRTLGAIKAANTMNLVTVAPFGSGTSNIPADAVAVMGNLTAVAYTGGGFLSIMPGGIVQGEGAGQYDSDSDPSSVNFITGQKAIANSFICGLGTGPNAGQVQVFVAGHSSHFIIDITAYIQ
jgi:hypothetical protein